MKTLVWNIFCEDSIIQAIDEENNILYWIEEKEDGTNNLYFSNDLFNLKSVKFIDNSDKIKLTEIAQSNYDNLIKLIS
jgi:hypothetical protein